MNPEKITSMAKHAAIEALITVVTTIPAFIVQNSHFVFSFTMTVIFYLPALKNGSVDAGLLYTGDVLGYYLPALAKTHVLLSGLNFTAIDFSLFNGSSDFFLSPNFFALHPLVVIYSLIVPAEFATLKDLGRFLVLLLALHSFLACYFSLKLFTRFFSFEFGVAGLVATAFAFSVYMVNATGQPPFVFSIAITPWAAYGALTYGERPTLRNLVLACLPVIFGFMGGYIPLGVASLALSVVLVAAKILVIDDSSIPIKEKVRALIIALLPFICASIIIAPYLYAVYAFNRETSGIQVVSLYYSAHQLAETPQTLLRLFSSHLSVPGPSYEFSLSWGFISIVIIAVFLFSAKTIDALTPREWKIFKVSALIYFATLLAIFGEFSVVSDLVYYLVPHVGEMHIYQRFLMAAHLLFALMVALMLKAVIQVRPTIVSRVVLTIFAVATLASAYLVGHSPIISQEIGINNYITFELLLGFLFACALIVPGKAFVYSVAIVLFSLPALDGMYDRSHGGNTLVKQRERQKVALDENEKARLVSYLKRFGDKAIIKYVDITPMWSKEGVETFPKDFPYFVLKEVRLSSYGGFTFYLSARADYMRKMPVMGDVAVSPDWELITNSGADFVVAREADLQKGALNSVLAQAKSEDLYKLPNDVVIVPLRTPAEKTLSSEEAIFDNGYFKVSPTISKTKLLNVAVGKSVRQSSTWGGEARLAVDGNTDGNFVHRSVTHSGQDVNAWLEVDLGQAELIDSVKIWNRTDCCGERLRDYWIFISEIPFLPSDTASLLRTRSATWSQVNLTPNPKSTIKTRGVRGRYVRVQLSGMQPIEESFLSLAEVEVFRSNQTLGAASAPYPSTVFDLKVNKFTTNHASYLHLDLETSAPATVQYLFWDNPRLNYYLNGKRANLTEKDGLRGIEVPAGHNTIDIRYRHWPLIVFWVFYTLYALVFLWVLTPARFRTGVWRKLWWPRSIGQSPS